jgi:hypothetical protein
MREPWTCEGGLPDTKCQATEDYERALDVLKGFLEPDCDVSDELSTCEERCMCKLLVVICGCVIWSCRSCNVYLNTR